MKYFFILIYIVTIIILIFAFQTKKTENYLDKVSLSNLTFEGKMGQERFSKDASRVTIIIWFHPDCEICRYQLNIINENIERFAKIRFFFITADTNFFKHKYKAIWPDLLQSTYVSFGIIDKSKFIDEFGPVVTPSLLLFDRKGILKEKRYGEVKVEKILYLINNISIPEKTISGSN